MAVGTARARETTLPARAALLRKFEGDVDPDRKLPEKERVRSAEHARKQYFTKLAYESARARRRTTGAGTS